MNYGMPYMGSKNKIAEKIINALPRAKHFYDLFGGGGAITHCALLSGKYKYIHYNELDPLVYKGFSMAVNGEFKNEKRWISHDDFYRLKSNDPYVAYCFSFGNNPTKGYCYSRDIELLKKAMHYAIVFDDFALLNDVWRGVNLDPEITKDMTSVYDKRIKICSEIQKVLQQRTQLQSLISLNRFQNLESLNKFQMLENVKRLENLERLNRVQSLERLDRFQSLERLGTFQNKNENAGLLMTNKSYDEVNIEQDSVVYCDPPYIGTNKYSISCFDHNRFYDWCKKQKNVFISEYTMPEDFKVFMEMKKNCTMDRNKVLKTVEKIFVNGNAEITTDLLF